MLLDEETEKPSRPRWLRFLSVTSGVVVVSGLGTALVFGVLQDPGPSKKKSVQEITVMRPPPPPPPKPEEKLPEPEVKKEEVKIPEEQPDPEPQQAEQAPPGPELGLDAAGEGNGDGFGLRARPGGQDVTTIGGGDRFGWYAGVLRTQIQKTLARNDRLRGADFKVVLWVWVQPDGSLSRVELKDSTGDREKDQKIQLALNEIPPLRDLPPEGLPQPIRFRISSTF